MVTEGSKKERDYRMITSKSLLTEVIHKADQPNGVFSDYKKLEDAALEVTKSHMGKMTPEYSHLKLLRWAEMRKFVISQEGGSVQVIMSA